MEQTSDLWMADCLKSWNNKIERSGMADKNLMDLSQIVQVDDSDMMYVVKGGTTDGRVSVGQLRDTVTKTVNGEVGDITLKAGTNVSIETTNVGEITINSELSIVRTPVPVSPLNGDVDVSVTAILEASPYGNLYGVARQHREFQVDVVGGDFSSPIRTIQINSDSWSIDPQIQDETQFKWRCRDVDVDGELSGWSDVQDFTTLNIYVVTPVIISPTEGAEQPERDQPITSSPFEIVNSNDSHAASYWTIKSIDGNIVYQTGRDVTNLTTWQPPLGVIMVGDFMIVEVVYESSGGVLSEPGVRIFLGSSAAYGKYLTVAHVNTPRITTYGVDVETFEKLSNPTGLPTSDAYAIKFSKDGKYIAVGSLNTPFIFMYQRNADSVVQIGSPSQITNGSNGFDFNADSTLMAVANSVSPYITLYSISGGVFTKLPDLNQLPTGRANSVSVSWDGVYIAVAFEVSPYVMVYKKNGAVYEVISGAISSPPPGNSTSLSFSQDGQYLAVSHASAPYVSIYKRNGDSFEKLANPTVTPTGTGRSVSFSSNANYLAVGHSTTPFLTIYQRSGDVFTKVQSPSTLPPSTANGVSFISDGSLLAVAHGNTPFLTIYKNVSGTFSKLSNPTSLPASTGNACSFYPSI